MEPFEYVMVLVSIVLGLAIAHILTALAAAVHRLKGHGPPIRLEPVYLLWVGYTLIFLVSFWWWEFKFQEMGIDWSYGLYLFVLAYAIALFLLAAVLVPDRMEGVTDSYEYFMEGRIWFLGGNVLVNVIDVMDTFMKGTAWASRPEVWAQTVVIVLASLVGIVSTRRPVQVACAATAFGVQLWYMFAELGVLRL